MMWYFRKRRATTSREIEEAQLKVAVARARADEAHDRLDRAVRHLLDTDGRKGEGRNGA